MNGMLLHCGAQLANRQQVYEVPTPAPMGPRHQPIPHHRFLELFEQAVRDAGFVYDQREYALAGKHNERFLIMLRLVPSTYKPNPSIFGRGWTPCIAGYTSHDQSTACRIALGHQVFICDNLCISGDHTIKTLHTTHIMDRLPRLLSDGMAEITKGLEQQRNRIACYDQAYCSDQRFSHLMVHAMDRGVVAPSKLPAVLKEWKEPRHAEWQPRSHWSAINTYTEVLKGTNQFDLDRRTKQLTELFDRSAKFDGRSN